jgi:hypothetical protein
MSNEEEMNLQQEEEALEQELMQVEEEVEVQEVEEVPERPNGYIDNVDDFVRKTGRPASEFKSKEQYDTYGQLINQIKKLESKIQTQNKVSEEMGRMYVKLEQDSYQKARADLEQQLQQAVDMGDFHQVQQVNNELNRINSQEDSLRQRQMLEERNKAEQAFMERNASWYNEANPEWVRKANELASTYAARNPNLTLNDVCELVEKEMLLNHVKQNEIRKTTPDISRNESMMNKSAAVTGGSGGAAFNRLDAKRKKEYFQMRNQFQQMGVDYSKEKFLEYVQNEYGE